MNVQAIKKLLARQPFEPFRVVLSSGDKYLVRHPENALLLKEGMMVSFAGAQRDDDGPEDLTVCSYLHIAALEPVLKAKESN